MIPRVHIQILDDSSNKLFVADKEHQKFVTSRSLADKLKNELYSSYPSMVSVEYVDLFMHEDDEYFNDISELLKQGALHTPVILINGMLKIHGGISPAVIKKEVEKLLFSGPVH
jgi:disulfide oxidoreductase YuzD